MNSFARFSSPFIIINYKIVAYFLIDKNTQGQHSLQYVGFFLCRKFKDLSEQYTFLVEKKALNLL
jgi:hypothetical protein